MVRRPVYLLANSFLPKPDVLLLDEPTNHLDMNSIAWLETYLLNYPGAVLIVSHDRYFLNRVVTKVIEVEQGQLILIWAIILILLSKKNSSEKPD